MSMNVTPLEMHQIQKLVDNIYVLNNSDLSRTQAKGIVHVLVHDASGQEVQINVPKTWIPINLGDYCDVPSITKASKFREFVRKGILVVISDEDAAALLSSGAGREEATRVNAASREVSAALRTNVVAADTRVVKHGEGNTNGLPPELAAQNSTPKIDPRVTALIEGYRAGASDAATVESIKSINGDKDSWIWASQQVRDTSSIVYQELAEKISSFDDESIPRPNDTPAPSAPTGTFTVNT